MNNQGGFWAAAKADPSAVETVRENSCDVVRGSVSDWMEEEEGGGGRKEEEGGGRGEEGRRARAGEKGQRKRKTTTNFINLITHNHPNHLPRPLPLPRKSIQFRNPRA